MKRWIGLAGALIAAAVLSKLNHPATDIGKLEPVEVVQLIAGDGVIRLRTDTGAAGEGTTLAGAVEDLRAGAAGEVFLETADYLLLTGDTAAFGAELDEFFRPASWVCLTGGEPDLETAADYLTVHRPAMTLGKLWAGEKVTQTLILSEEGGRLDGP